MEQNATGADKVLCLCNREYAEKADARKGGAGTEAQVLSPQVFTQIKQERIIPVLFGADERKAYRPTFLSHLIYVDLRLPQRRYDNFEELMRVILDEDLLEFTVSEVYENEARYVVAHYLFVHYVAKLIRANAWEAIRDLLARSYVVDRYGQRTTHSFTIFNAEVRHLEDHASRGPLADLLHEFARAAGLKDAELLEAVLFLMFRATVHRSGDNNEYWYPYELQRSPATIPTVLFVRAESRNFLEKLLVALDTESIDDLKGDEVKREIEGWQGAFRNLRARYIPPLYLFNFEKLGTRP
jgi:hypothetical protein